MIDFENVIWQMTSLQYSNQRDEEIKDPGEIVQVTLVIISEHMQTINLSFQTDAIK